VSLLCAAGAQDAAGVTATIASLRAQIYPEWELVLVPIGSGGVQLAGAPDPRIRLGRSDAPGRSAALAAGLAAARGDLVALVDPGARLAPQALYAVARAFAADPEVDLVYGDEDRLSPAGDRVAPAFKPGWSPNLILSTNYTGRLCVFRRQAALEAGGVRPGFEGAEDYDLALRLSERARRIRHVPEVLYHGAPVAEGTGAEGGRRAVESALARRAWRGEVSEIGPGCHRVRLAIGGEPLVSIVIPTRDRVELLRACVSSILQRSTWKRIEILVVDNRSSDPVTLEYLRSLPAPHRILAYPGEFNWSAINNFAAREARGDHLLFLNNDVEVVAPDWIEAMLEHAQRPEVGAVGAKLLYPDGTVQHAGVVLGIGGFADHAFRHLSGEAPGYLGLASLVRDVSAVTGACMMVRREVFESLGGVDERLRVAFNDVDFCLRLGERCLAVVYTPHALLTHHESASRGRLHPRSEYLFMRRRWGEVVARGDRYYSPNLTLDREDFGIDL